MAFTLALAPTVHAAASARAFVAHRLEVAWPRARVQLPALPPQPRVRWTETAAEAAGDPALGPVPSP